MSRRLAIAALVAIALAAGWFAEGEYEPRFIGTFEVDLSQYPPGFLLLPLILDGGLVPEPVPIVLVLLTLAIQIAALALNLLVVLTPSRAAGVAARALPERAVLTAEVPAAPVVLSQAGTGGIIVVCRQPTRGGD